MPTRAQKAAAKAEAEAAAKKAEEEAKKAKAEAAKARPRLADAHRPGVAAAVNAAEAAAKAAGDAAAAPVGEVGRPRRRHAAAAGAAAQAAAAPVAPVAPPVAEHVAAAGAAAVAAAVAPNNGRMRNEDDEVIPVREGPAYTEANAKRNIKMIDDFIARDPKPDDYKEAEKTVLGLPQDSVPFQYYVAKIQELLKKQFTQYGRKNIEALQEKNLIDILKGEYGKIPLKILESDAEAYKVAMIKLLNKNPTQNGYQETEKLILHYPQDTIPFQVYANLMAGFVQGLFETGQNDKIVEVLEQKWGRIAQAVLAKDPFKFSMASRLKADWEAAYNLRRKSYREAAEQHERLERSAKQTSIRDFNNKLSLAEEEIDRFIDGDDKDYLRAELYKITRIPMERRAGDAEHNQLAHLFDKIIEKNKMLSLKLFKYASSDKQRSIGRMVQKNRNTYNAITARLNSSAYPMLSAHGDANRHAIGMAGVGMLRGNNIGKLEELKEYPWIQDKFALTGLAEGGGRKRRSTRKRASRKRRHTRKHYS